MKPARPSNALHHVSIAALGCLLLLALVVAVHAQATRRSETARSLFVASTGEVTWLARPTMGPEKDAAKWAVLRRSSKPPADESWVPVAILPQRPRAIATYGERLAVLFPDGTWSLISPTGHVNGPPPPATLKLVGVIDATEKLTFLARDKTDDTKLLVLDFDGGGFAEPRAPETVGERGFNEPRFAMARKGSVFIVEHEVADDYEDFASSSDGQLQALRGADDAVKLLSVERSDAKLTLPPAALAGRMTLSHDRDGSARFWWLEGEQVVSQAYSLDGKPKAGPTTVAVRPPPSPPIFERALYVVGAVTLLLVMLAGGRQTIAVTRALAAKVPPKPAPLARRLAAGVIDYFPLVLTAAYLVSGGKLTLLGGMLRFDNHRSEAILAAGVLLYLTLLVACELRWQQSIGKMVFALRVVSIDGGKPLPRAVLIRNVLRLVDLNLITLLIVLATPLRQRLGDFIAGTMVIDALDAKSSPPDRESPDDRADNK